MKSYTVGFVFDSNLEEVVLILKTHPDWQKGKLNGIGGKTEEGETNLDCIVRETEEETGLVTAKDAWTHFVTMFQNGNKIDFYAMVHEGEKTDLETITEEKVSWYKVNELPNNIIANLSWLIPIALEKLEGAEIEVVEVRYN